MRAQLADWICRSASRSSRLVGSLGGLHWCASRCCRVRGRVGGGHERQPSLPWFRTCRRQSWDIRSSKGAREVVASTRLRRGRAPQVCSDAFATAAEADATGPLNGRLGRVSLTACVLNAQWPHPRPGRSTDEVEVRANLRPERHRAAGPSRARRSYESIGMERQARRSRRERPRS